ADSDLGPRSVLQPVPLLLIGQKFGGFKVDAVQTVNVKNDLPTVGPLFTVEDAAVRDPAVRHQEAATLGLIVDLFLSAEDLEKSHFNPSPKAASQIAHAAGLRRSKPRASL